MAPEWFALTVPVGVYLTFRWFPILFTRNPVVGIVAGAAWPVTWSIALAFRGLDRLESRARDRANPSPTPVDPDIEDAERELDVFLARPTEEVEP